MKYFAALIILMGCLCSSIAYVAVEEVDNTPLEIKRVVSTKKQQAKITIDEDSLVISEEIINQFLQIVEQAEEQPGQVFNINENIDSIISAVAREILLGPYDPADLSDQDVVFEYRPLLITYTGTLNLTVGRLQDLSTVRRSSDATLVSEGSRRLRISIPLSFTNILASYNFLMNVRRDTAEGVLHSWVSDKIGSYDAEIDLGEGIIVSKSFVVDIGSLSINLFGSGLSSAYTRLITDLTTDLLNDVIIEYAEVIVGGYLNAGIKSVLGVN